MNAIVSGVTRGLSRTLIQEAAVLSEVAEQVEWIERELRLMQAVLEHFELSGPVEEHVNQWAEELRGVAIDAEDAIETYVNKSIRRRRKGIRYLIDQYTVGKELQQISKRMKDISQRGMNYKQTEIRVVVESSAGTSASPNSAIVASAVEKLSYILNQNSITNHEAKMIVEEVRDGVVSMQRVLSRLNPSQTNERERVWLEEVEVVCNSVGDVVGDFITRRERWSSMGRLKHVLAPFEGYYCNRELEEEMRYIGDQIGDAHVRSLTYGVQEEGVIESRSVVPIWSLQRVIISELPFLVYYILIFPFNGLMSALQYLVVILDLEILSAQLKLTVPPSPKARPKETFQQSAFRFLEGAFKMYLGSFSINLVANILSKIVPLGMLILLQCVLVLLWTATAWKSGGKNFVSIRRDFALMRALLRDTEAERGEGLNERQKIWVQQIKVKAQGVQALLAAYDHSMGQYAEAGVLRRFFLRVDFLIKFGGESNRMLYKIQNISERKTIYDITNIEGRKDLASSGQCSGNEIEIHSVVESNDNAGTLEEPLLPTGDQEYRPVRGFEEKVQLLREEIELMEALFKDVDEMGELDGRSKLWVKQLGDIFETASALDDRATKFQQMPLPFKILNYRRRVTLKIKIKRINKRIRDDSTRRKTYGLDKLQTKAESFPIVQRLLPKMQVPLSLIVEQEALLAPLLSDEKRRCVTSIVRISGEGKTTLDKLIFDNRRVIDHFDYQVWVPASQHDTAEPLVQHIAKKMMGVPEYRLTSEEDLTQTLEKFLENRRYLIVVDDIQNLQDWETLRKTLPEMSIGCRLVLTTSNPDVMLQASPRTFVLFETLDTIYMNLPLHLKRCLDFFVLFPAESGIPARRLVALSVADGSVLQGEEEDTPEDVGERYLTELIELGMVQVDKEKHNGKVKTCRLTNHWREFLLIKARESRFLPDHTDRGILRMGFAFLCYVLENFTNPTVTQPLTAWLLQMQRQPQPQFKTPVVRQVADHLDQEQICYNHIHGDTRSPSVSIRTHYSDALSFLSFDRREGSKPGQDIGTFLKRCIANDCFFLLRVLDLERVYKPQLPENIGKLSRLRYLGLRWTYVESLPSSVRSLLKLQTLDLKHTYISTLTNSIWKMQLRHLFLSEAYRTRFPPQRKHNYLSDLQTLWGLFIDEESPVKNGLDRLVKIKKLGLACQSMSPQPPQSPQQGAVESQVAAMLPESPQQGTMESQLEAVANWLQKLDHLESLRLKSRDEEGLPWKLPLKSMQHLKYLTNMYLLGNLTCHSSIQSLFPQSLIELTLSHSTLKQDSMQILKDLPKLRSLSLFAESYVEETMFCQSGSFPKLQVLKLWKLEQLQKWEIEQGALPCLEELEIRSCGQLKMLPEGLQHVRTLFKLQLTNMSKFKDRIRENGDDWHKIEHIPDRGISFL